MVGFLRHTQHLVFLLFFAHIHTQSQVWWLHHVGDLRELPILLELRSKFVIQRPCNELSRLVLLLGSLAEHDICGSSILKQFHVYRGAFLWLRYRVGRSDARTQLFIIENDALVSLLSDDRGEYDRSSRVAGIVLDP